MQIDLEHLHYWMCAIRESKNPIRTLDAFWSGQLKSKEWLIEVLKNQITTPSSIDIYGGWVGVLASMIFQSEIPIKNIRSIDIDRDCENISNLMNMNEKIEGRFEALTADMCDIPSNADVVINTSCEHITQHQYNKWLENISKNSLIILQSNNYKIDEHIRTVDNLEDFKNQSCLNIIHAEELKLPLYTRFMIVGRI